MKTKRKVAPLAATIITIGSLLGGANAQTNTTFLTPEVLGLSYTPNPVNGTYDISGVTGISGLEVTVTNGYMINSLTPGKYLWVVGKELVPGSFPIQYDSHETTFTFNQNVDAILRHGRQLDALSSDYWSSNGSLSGQQTPLDAGLHDLTSGLTGQVSNSTFQEIRNGNGPSGRFIWEASGTQFHAWTTGQGMDNGIGIAVVSPVPEPSSTALLGLGALTLIMRRRR